MPSQLATQLRPLLDQLRGFPGAFGLRAYNVSFVVRLWGGERPGVGAFQDFTTVIGNTVTYGNGKSVVYPPRVDQLTAKDVIAANGLYSERDYKVGPLTLQYLNLPKTATGGVTLNTFAPRTYNVAAEEFWNVTGPELPDSGVVFRKIATEGTALHFYVTLQATGKIP